MKKYFKPYDGTLGRMEYIISILIGFGLSFVATFFWAIFGVVELSKYETGADFLKIEQIPVQTKMLLFWDRAPYSSILGIVVFIYVYLLYPFFCWEKRIAQIIKDRAYTTALVFVAWILQTIFIAILLISGSEPSIVQAFGITFLTLFSSGLFIFSLFVKGKHRS